MKKSLNSRPQSNSIKNQIIDYSQNPNSPPVTLNSRLNHDLSPRVIKIIARLRQSPGYHQHTLFTIMFRAKIRNRFCSLFEHQGPRNNQETIFFHSKRVLRRPGLMNLWGRACNCLGSETSLATDFDEQGFNGLFFGHGIIHISADKIASFSPNFQARKYGNRVVIFFFFRSREVKVQRGPKKTIFCQRKV